MAAVGSRTALSWRDTLQRHLDAIQTRNLQALGETIAEELVVIAADGKVMRTAEEFLDTHRAWFEMEHWTLYATPVEVRETGHMAYAVLHLLYCEDAPGKPALRQQSQLTLVFEQRAGKWVMVLDQNTPMQ